MKVKLFQALPKQNKRMGELQGIMFPNGCVKVGIDVWRELSKHDFPSHPVYEYESIKQLHKEYEVKKPRVTRYVLLNNQEGGNKEWLSCFS